MLLPVQYEVTIVTGSNGWPVSLKIKVGIPFKKKKWRKNNTDWRRSAYGVINCFSFQKKKKVLALKQYILQESRFASLCIDTKIMRKVWQAEMPSLHPAREISTVCGMHICSAVHQPGLKWMLIGWRRCLFTCLIETLCWDVLSFLSLIKFRLIFIQCREIQLKCHQSKV